MKFTKRILAVGLVGAMLVTAGCSSKGEVNESKGENSAQTQSIVFAAGEML